MFWGNLRVFDPLITKFSWIKNIHSQKTLRYMYCYDLSKFLTLWAICLSFCELEGLRIVSIEFESSFAKEEICGSIWILIFANSVSYKWSKKSHATHFHFQIELLPAFTTPNFWMPNPMPMSCKQIYDRDRHSINRRKWVHRKIRKKLFFSV